MQEEELSVDDILSSIRTMLTNELNGQHKRKKSSTDGLLTVSDLDLDEQDTVSKKEPTSVIPALERDEADDIFVLKNPVSQKDPLTGDDIFVLTPEMRVDVKSKEDIRQQAKQALMKMAAQNKTSGKTSLSPEMDKQMRILLNEWLKNNLPEMIEQVLDRELIRLKK